jgi:hypothetical protein
VRRALPAVLLVSLATAAPVSAAQDVRRPDVARAAAQTVTQRFFAARLLADRRTSREIRTLLSTGAGFVDRGVPFRDLTGDGRSDAVVRVQSGGVLGAVALYVFSTDAGRRHGPLRAVYRAQRLQHAETRIRDGVLRYRSAAPGPADDPCCPARATEARLRWREARHRFEVVERRDVAPADPWGDELAPPAG